MKPREKKPEIVHRIIDRASGEAIGSYSRACCNEYDFRSVEEARSANVHGLFQDRVAYAIATYRLTYELLNPDTDGAPATVSYTVDDGLPMTVQVLCACGVVLLEYQARATRTHPVRYSMELKITCAKCDRVSDHKVECYGDAQPLRDEARSRSPSN